MLNRSIQSNRPQPGQAHANPKHLTGAEVIMAGRGEFEQVVKIHLIYIH
jgi:hypothetical protein